MKLTKRNTTQFLMPLHKNGDLKSGYEIYPSQKLGEGQISTDLNLLVNKMRSQSTVVIDGYVGVFFEEFRLKLEAELLKIGIKANWVNVAGALKSEKMIDRLISPFMGEDNSIFGTRATIDLKDYFEFS